MISLRKIAGINRIRLCENLLSPSIIRAIPGDKNRNVRDFYLIIDY